mmetsp:Transcript_3022/g.6615  ORF Transcript_3022/g.6615 Transcript_3022/m.6615 type:complete len:561 (+) Transcript_3022:240-1922(+)|eukprot:CAMPEP_0172313362 /NCGR_PEP_ID=MMETSP1058-20130122/20131_1 /TAXON_ID=83371 /ORGANISM="Detonula confervacea, Strain CCMP 353" /LENGTH=560 /DNA_ID=CAMNT_0013027007 /DNA_START=230 /DNA_END=1912 /DNA_ORIENTATION=-
MVFGAHNGENNDQRLIGVTTVNDRDIICGRGGLALKHPGNSAYRKIVSLNKELYATCLKTEKLRISKSIVAAIREITGRFLEREDGKTSASLEEKDDDGNLVAWRDIGDKRAVEKTSQALREGQPKLLKKLAQQQDSGVLQAPLSMNGLYNNVGVAPQSQIMPQYGQMELLQQTVQDFNQLQGGGPMFGHQPPVQNTFQAQQRPSFTAQHRPSLTMASLVEGQTFGAFPGNSFVDMSRAGSHRSNPNDSWNDSWGSGTLTPLAVGATGRGFDRSNSQKSHDSWGEEDPMPLPYHEMENHGTTGGNAFSSVDHHELMTVLGVEGEDGAQNATGGIVARPGNKRPSVKFNLPSGRASISGNSVSAMSLLSHLSELSIFSEALSLDSAMEAAEREAEFDMLGEFDEGDGDDGGEMSIGTFESGLFGSHMSGSGHTPKPRRSILRKSHKWTHQTATFPLASSNNRADPGLIFTSTLDTKPGGINSGTDVSGLLGERRKSAVAFEIDVKRRRSSRMSMCSALTDISGKFKRDIGSVLSIQSADFRELMADMDDDDEDYDDQHQLR